LLGGAKYDNHEIGPYICHGRHKCSNCRRSPRRSRRINDDF
jgi:hypothetical protein